MNLNLNETMEALGFIKCGNIIYQSVIGDKCYQMSLPIEEGEWTVRFSCDDRMLFSITIGVILDPLAVLKVLASQGFTPATTLLRNDKIDNLLTA